MRLPRFHHSIRRPRARSVCERRGRGRLRPDLRPRLLAAIIAGILLASLFAASAHASYELVQTFGEGAASGPKAEEGLYSAPGGVAVNDATGDVYVADSTNQRVLRFDSQGHFREAWGWGVGDGKNEYERCGPEGEIARCEGAADTGKGHEGEGVGELKAPGPVAVDQSTGDVYVGSYRQKGVVQVFSAKGDAITSFGEVSSEPVSASPQMMHDSSSLGVNSMVVDPGTGYVYVLDVPFTSESRVMVFKPKTPARQEYEYLEELFTGKYTSYAQAIVEDAGGDFYLSHDGVLYKFNKGDFAAPAWEKSVPEGGGMAVEPSSGDLLRYATHSTKIERYSAANGSVTEKFGTGESGVDNELVTVYSMALSPDLSWSPGRPPGILYGDMPVSPVTRRPAHLFALTQLPVTPPTVDSESASFIGSGSATLTAQINPNGYETHFRFQYGTEACSSHPCSEAPLGAADLGAGSVDLTAGVELSGLMPETTYRYRVLATNLYGDTVEGAEQTFTTYPPLVPGLPDGRVYEMVSPPEKYGGEVFSPDAGVASCTECKPGENSARDPMQSAPDGNAVVYEGTPFAQAGDAIEQNEYRSKRTATGWRTEDLSPTADPADAPYGAVSADLSIGVLQWKFNDPLLSPEAPPGYANIYLRGADGNMRPLVTAQPSGIGGLVLRFAGASAASADFSHVVFEANYALTGGTAFAPPAQGTDRSRRHGPRSWPRRSDPGPRSAAPERRWAVPSRSSSPRTARSGGR